VRCTNRYWPAVTRYPQVDLCQPGDDVIVTGVVRRMWNPVVRDVRCDVEIFLEANHVRVINGPRASQQPAGPIDAHLQTKRRRFM
jgi:hypothetical protein